MIRPTPTTNPLSSDDAELLQFLRTAIREDQKSNPNCIQQIADCRSSLASSTSSHSTLIQPVPKSAVPVPHPITTSGSGSSSGTGTGSKSTRHILTKRKSKRGHHRQCKSLGRNSLYTAAYRHSLQSLTEPISPGTTPTPTSNNSSTSNHRVHRHSANNSNLRLFSPTTGSNQKEDHHHYNLLLKRNTLPSFPSEQIQQNSHHNRSSLISNRTIQSQHSQSAHSQSASSELPHQYIKSHPVSAVSIPTNRDRDYRSTINWVLRDVDTACLPLSPILRSTFSTPISTASVSNTNTADTPIASGIGNTGDMEVVLDSNTNSNTMESPKHTSSLSPDTTTSTSPISKMDSKAALLPKNKAIPKTPASAPTPHRPPFTADHLRKFADQFQGVRVTFASASSFLDKIHKERAVRIKEKPRSTIANLKMLHIHHASTSTPALIQSMSGQSSPVGKRDMALIDDGNDGDEDEDDDDGRSDDEFDELDTFGVLQNQSNLQLLHRMKKKINRALREADDIETAIHMVWEREYHELEKRLHRLDKKNKVGMYHRASYHQHQLNRDTTFLTLKEMSESTTVNDDDHDTAVHLLKTYFPDTDDDMSFMSLTQSRSRPSSPTGKKVRIKDSSRSRPSSRRASYQENLYLRNGADPSSQLYRQSTTYSENLSLYDTMIRKARASKIHQEAKKSIPPLQPPPQMPAMKPNKSAPAPTATAKPKPPKPKDGIPKLETIYSENSSATVSDVIDELTDPDDIEEEEEGDQLSLAETSRYHREESRIESTPSTTATDTQPRSRFNSIGHFDDEQFIQPTLAMVQSPPLHDPAFLSLATRRYTMDAESMTADTMGIPMVDISLRISSTESEILPVTNGGGVGTVSQRVSLFSRASSKSIEVQMQNEREDTMPHLVQRQVGKIQAAQSTSIQSEEKEIHPLPGTGFQSPHPSRRVTTSPATPPRNLLGAMAKYSDKMDSWDFDVFEFMNDPCFFGKPLIFAGFYLFRKTGLLDATGVSQANFWRFLDSVQNGYLDNPYHNMYHAVDVMLNTHYMFNSSLFKKHMTIWDQFGCYIAAVCHDLGHMGLNNQWYIDTAGNLALLYGDESVLENYHIAETFRILNDPDCNWMVAFPSSVRRYLATVIRRTILATDMKVHGSKMMHLGLLVDAYKEAVTSKLSGADHELNKENQHRLISEHIQFHRCESVENYASLTRIMEDDFPLFVDDEYRNVNDIIIKDLGEDVDDDSKELDENDLEAVLREPRVLGVDDERLFLLEITVHACDVANPCKPLDICRKWADRYLAEVFIQGDCERNVGIPVSAGMDRYTSKLPPSQIGFIQYVVKKMMELYTELIDCADICQTNLLKNEQYWIGEKNRMSFKASPMIKKGSPASAAPDLSVITE